MKSARNINQQKGVVMVVSLVMLTIMTLVILSAANMSQTNLRAVGNLQFRNEALSIANYAIERVISTDFTAAPVEAIWAIDTDRDGDIDSTDGTDENTDYIATTAIPVCKSWRIIPTSELDVTNPDDLQCFVGGSTGGSGLSGAAGVNSFCAETLWEVSATVTDQVSGASVSASQGVHQRMSVTLAENSCD